MLCMQYETQDTRYGSLPVLFEVNAYPLACTGVMGKMPGALARTGGRQPRAVKDEEIIICAPNKIPTL